MPKYYFDLEGLAPASDEVGVELPNNEAAWRDAKQFAAELLKDVGGRSRPGDGWRLTVSDANRKQLYVVHIHSEKVS
jgi:hypothetical protein